MMPKKAAPAPPVKHKITHIMADGTVRDSVKGYVIPYNEHTAICYELLAKYARPKEDPVTAPQN
jgi:hypothetical protein